MPKILLGAIFVTLAGVSLWDAHRITTTLRRPGGFDSLGPDRYLLAVAIVLLVLGIGLVVQGVLERRARIARPAAEKASDRHLWLLGAICGYVGLMALIGYAPATLLFFLAALWIMGQHDWRWNIPSSLALAVVFVLIFEYAADISLPKGVFR